VKTRSMTPSVEMMRFIADNILAYSATGRGTDGEIGWNTQRDQTHLLSESE